MSEKTNLTNEAAAPVAPAPQTVTLAADEVELVETYRRGKLVKQGEEAVAKLSKTLRLCLIAQMEWQERTGEQWRRGVYFDSELCDLEALYSAGLLERREWKYELTHDFEYRASVMAHGWYAVYKVDQKAAAPAADKVLTPDETEFIHAFRQGDILTMLEMLHTEDGDTFEFPPPKIKQPPRWMFTTLSMALVNLLVKYYIEPKDVNKNWPLNELYDSISDTITRVFFDEPHAIEDVYLVDLVNWKRSQKGHATRLFYSGPYKRYDLKPEPSPAAGKSAEGEGDES